MTVFSHTLSSGSSGNCILFSHNGTNILIDCGMSGKRAAELLNASGIAPESLRCIFVTHEHIDHTSGVGLCPENITFRCRKRRNLGRHEYRQDCAGKYHTFPVNLPVLILTIFRYSL